MIYLSLYNNCDIKIDTDNESILREVKNHFTWYEKNYYWTYSYQSGLWDGKVSLFSSAKRTLPVGLLLRLFKFLKDNGYTDIDIEDNLKNYFNSSIKNIEYNYDLKYPPRDYQKDCIEDAIKKGHGIYLCSTGSGKSLIISYIIKILYENNITKNHLIIVPTVQLVDQFKSDIIDYGIDKKLIGIANKDYKQFDHPIVISTWQTLKNNKDKLKDFDLAVCDETHSAKSKEINKIMKVCTANMDYVFGVTGTLPDNILEKNRIISYIGPVWKEYKVDELSKKGYLSQCNIKQIKIKYNKSYQGDWNQIKYDVFRDDYRLKTLKSIVQNNNFVLILVEKVKDEGEFIEEYLKNNLEEKEVMFLSGRDKSTIREVWRKNMEKNGKIVIIATYGIFQLGINIKSLQNVVILSSSKSKIRVLQSIGRSLRLHENKKESGAYIWDFADMVKNLKQHANARERYYIKEGFNIQTIEMNEKYDKNMNKLFC